MREVAAKTLQERPRLIERIANRAWLYLFDVTVVQQFAATSSLDGTYSTQNGLVSAQPVRCEEGGHVVLCKVLSGSGYRLRPTSKIGEFTRNSGLLSKFEFRWLRLAEQAHGTGGALGHESGLTATSFPLHDKPAAYPAEYAKRAGELIARSALSLQRLRQKKKAGQ